MNCHSQIYADSQYLEIVRTSFKENKPLEWTRVHDLPDYVYFNHSIHVNKGIGCASCHGRVDQMPIVYEAASLQMEWCLACHRQPERYLRPKDKITDMTWNIEADAADDVTADPFNRLAENLAPKRKELGLKLKQEYRIRNERVLTSCSTCHR
jgi:cytochrome c peroxidase